MPRRMKKQIWFFCRDQRGVSAIEFAVIASIVCALALGAFDLGNAAQQRVALEEAVRAGGQYAIHFPTNVTASSSDPISIQSVVTNALPVGWSLSNPGGVPVVACSCPNNVSGTFDCSTLPAQTACASPLLVSITATMNYAAVALEPWVAQAIPTISATYVTRFQ
jgi:Flp pilus assembly pilin Flp